MGEVLLTAGKNPLFVADATGTASTSVKYDSMYPIHLWRRLDGGAWTEENLVGSARSAAEAADLEKRGKRTTPTMGPGQFVEYGALFEGVDPNTKGFRDSAFRGYLMIDVLLNPTTLATPGPDTGLFPGGTFVRQRLATTEPARLRFQIGRQPPVADSNGFLRLPDVKAEKFSTFGQLHDVEVAPLVPGTGYQALTLLVTPRGDWQAIGAVFRTKRRKVTIQFKNFVVHNDSDEDPHGVGDEAEVSVGVFVGKNLIRHFHWGPGDFSDVAGANKVPVSYSDEVVGPDAFEGEDPGVGISLYALERDYFFWIPSTDEAAYAGQRPTTLYVPKKPLPFPTGSSREVVNPATTDTNFDITATRLDSDGHLWLTANLRYLVSYE